MGAPAATWKYGASMYLLSYFAHMVSMERPLEYDRAREAIAKRFEHLDSNNPTEKAVMSKMSRLAKSLGYSLSGLKKDVRDRGIEFAFSTLSEDKLQEVQSYLGELGNSSLKTGVVPRRPRSSDGSSVSNTSVSAFDVQPNMRMRRTDGEESSRTL
jgi:hypothetical protein